MVHWAADGNHTNFINFALDPQKLTRYSALQRVDIHHRIHCVLAHLISACRACTCVCAGYSQSVRVIHKKSMKIQLSNDFGR